MAWGSVQVQSERGRFALASGTYLLLAEERQHRLRVSSERPSLLLALRFARGYLPSVGRQLVGDRRSFDLAPGAQLAMGLLNARPQGDRIVALLLSQVHRAAARGRCEPLWFETKILELASRLWVSLRQVRRAIERAPAARLATRCELVRRVQRARDYVEGSLRADLRLDVVAGPFVLSLVAEGVELALVAMPNGALTQDPEVYFAIGNRPSVLLAKLGYNSGAAFLAGYGVAWIAGRFANRDARRAEPVGSRASEEER